MVYYFFVQVNSLSFPPESGNLDNSAGHWIPNQVGNDNYKIFSFKKASTLRF